MTLRSPTDIRGRRTSRRRLKILLWLLVLAIVVGAACFWLAGRRKAAAPVLNYTVASITRGDLLRSVTTTGQLAPLVCVEVSTQISGLITEVAVDFNSHVTKGQVLARIDSSTYEQDLKQAKADLAAAEAAHRLAQLTVDRYKRLLDAKLETQQDYDQADAQLQQQDATLLTRRAAIENAQLNLDRCTITSPIDGIVLYKAADVGKTVQASFSAPTLFAIAKDLKKMQIDAQVSEVDVWSVKPGQEVTFTVDALPDRVFKGVVRQIRDPYTPSDKQSSASANSGGISTFDTIIEVENPDEVLMPSITANVSIIVSGKKGVLRVPNSALRVQLPPDAGVSAPAPGTADGQNRAVVYRLPGGNRTAKPVPVVVRLGLSDSLMTEVLDGLNEGDVVVTGFKQSFSPGLRVMAF
jgi:HlyD family secretion protein